MSGESYVVDASIRLNATQSNGALAGLGSRLSALGSQISGTSSGLRGMLTPLLGVASAYVGVNALVGGFSRLTSGAIAYQQSLEATEIGLSSVMSAVDGMSFDQARVQAREVFGQIREDAIRSVATSQELFSIYQGIFGPLRNADQSLQSIRQTTLDVVSASSALGIDFAQASRDVQAMSRGAAGVDVRLFSMLRSTGAIAEDAEAFNQLSAPERISRMQRALQQFSGAAEAYGSSFAGVTSTFTDVIQNLSSAFFGPAFAELTSFLAEVNSRLLGGRDQITAGLTRAGEAVAGLLGRGFDSVLNGMTYVTENWDVLVDKGEAFVARMRELVPLIRQAAEAWVAMSLARQVVGFGLSTAGAGLSLAGAAGAAGLLPAGATAGAAGAAAGAGGATAITALTTALAPLAPLVAPLVALLAAVGTVVTVVISHWDAFLELFSAISPLLDLIGGDFAQIGSDLWDLLQPALEAIGGVLVLVLVPAFTLLLATIHAVLMGVRLLTGVLGTLGRFIQSYVGPVIEQTVRDLAEIIDWFTGGNDLQLAANRLSEAAGQLTDVTSPEPAAPSVVQLDAVRVRPTQHNDFRGSRITVQQEFRQADPDRVFLQMVDDLNRQAESRLRSPFAPFPTG